jgi:hypothetical protein
MSTNTKKASPNGGKGLFSDEIISDEIISFLQIPQSYRLER